VENRGRRVLVVVLLSCCWAVGSRPVSALDAPGKPPAATVSGTVVDPAGRPAAGAKIWLTRADFPHEAEVLQTAIADAAGRFTLRDPPRDGPPKGWLTLAARDAKGRLGGTYLPPRGDPAGQSIRIELAEVRDYRGRLTDADGGPVAKVALRPMRTMAMAPERPLDRHPFAFPPELAAEVVARTGDDGRFVLRGVPVEGDVMVEVVAPQFGSPWIFWELHKSVTIRLERPGSVAGSLAGRGGLPVAGVRVRLNKIWDPDDARYFGYSVSGDQETRAATDGSFLFPAVLPGTYAVQGQLEEKSLSAAGVSPRLRVKPGERTANIAIIIRRLVTIRGQVVDRQTKAGVPGVSLQFYTTLDTQNPPLVHFVRTAKTDARGEYSLQLLPGRINGGVNSCPENYYVAQPGVKSPRELWTEDGAWPVIELDRGTSVEGIAVDEAGRPAAEAELRLLQASPNSVVESAKCDRSGKFVLKQRPAKGTIAIQARTDSAATIDPVTVAVSQAMRPLRLVLSQNKAGSVRGFLTDEAGQPIRRADVFLTGFWNVGVRQHSFQIFVNRADDRGRFEIRGLWPGRYQVGFTAEDLESPSRTVTLRQGQSIDFGKIVLDSSRGAITGIVIDSAGKPLPGVVVFNSGDAPGRISTRTDAGGHFRLQGFRLGPAYVFAQRPGYRFRAVLAASGATAVAVCLPRCDEPPPPRPAPRQLSENERHDLARAMLEKFWAAGDRTKMDEAIVAMAMLDPQRAQQWSAGRGEEIKLVLRAYAAMRIAETDPEEAIGLLPADGAMTVEFIRLFARRLAAGEPANALRYAEEGIVRARGLSQPERAQALAGFGSLLVRLGRQPAGRKLVEEAAGLAARLPATPSATRARGEVAAAVAAFDLKRALELLNPIGDVRAYLPQITAAASVSQPEQVRALWKGLDPFYLSRAKTMAACRLAESRPDEALRTVEEIEGDRAPDQKVEALGWIAEAVARRDKPRALAIVDRALALAMEPPTGNARVYCQDLPVKAAIVAVHAQQIGYPDLQGVSDRVVASRLPFRVATTPAFENSVAMAAILALADPHAAGRLLRVLESQTTRWDAAENPRTKAQWFQAWALADPRHAVELADRQWAAGSKTPGWDISASGILDVPLVLSLPRSMLLEYVGQGAGDGPPGE
jgi:hypothetical protein